MRRRHGERGAVLAEFAIASTAALTLMFGIFDFGRAMFIYHLVSEGARMGSRYAIVRGAAACAGGTPDPSKAYVVSQSPGADPSVLTVVTTCSAPVVCTSSVTTSCSNVVACIGSASNNIPGCLVTVTVTYPFTFIVPLVSKLKPTMKSTSTMVISQS
jgi:Flp pilus assembly protein TadG